MKNQRFKDYLFVGIQLFLFLIYVLDVDILIINIPEYPIYIAYLLFTVAVLLGILAVLQLSTNLSPFPSPKEGSSLVTSGVFKFSRHPIYSAIISAAISYGLIQGSLYKIIITCLLSLLFYFKSNYEESLLIQKFPEYKNYMKNVGRFYPKFLK